MLCNWCDEPIVMETGDYKMVFRRRYKRLPAHDPMGDVVFPKDKAYTVPDGWDEEYFHDYCFEDGTRGEDVSEDKNGELYIL